MQSTTMEDTVTGEDRHRFFVRILIIRVLIYKTIFYDLLKLQVWQLARKLTIEKHKMSMEL